MSEEEHTLPPPAPWPFIEVVWEDSATDDVSWTSHDDLSDQTITIITRGWLVKETKRAITLAASYYWSDNRWFFGEKVTIPRKALVSEIKALKSS